MTGHRPAPFVPMYRDDMTVYALRETFNATHRSCSKNVVGHRIEEFTIPHSLFFFHSTSRHMHGAVVKLLPRDADCPPTARLSTGGRGMHVFPDFQMFIVYLENVQCVSEKCLTCVWKKYSTCNQKLFNVCSKKILNMY